MATDSVMLTTIDNPWNPFSHFDEWYVFDETSGYHTTALLARVTISSEELSDLAYEKAIDEICSMNVSGIHTKAYPNSENHSEKVS